MQPAEYHTGLARALWEAIGFGSDERHPPRAPWWLENRGRIPRDLVVFQYVSAGRAILRDSGGDHEVLPRHAFLFAYGEATAYGRPPDRPDWPGHDEGLSMDHVAVRGPGLVDLWTTLRARFGPVIKLPKRPAALDALYDFVRVALPRLAGDRWAVARETVDLVGQLVREIERADAAAQAPVERAVEELLRFPFRDTGLKEIALRHGCTREHLCRVFTLRTGEPPGRHLARLRLERALQLLAQTDLSLAAVAQRCGAGSAHTLARWVRSATGRGPRVLRQAARRGAG